MEPDLSLLHLQDPATCLCPEQDQTNPSPIPLLDNPFQYFPPINALAFEINYFPQVLPPTPSMDLCFPLHATCPTHLPFLHFVLSITFN